MSKIYFEKELKGTAIINGKVCKIKNDGSMIGSVNCKWCEFNTEHNLEHNYIKCSMAHKKD